MERVSPSVIFLRPPEKLVIELKASGRYSRINWIKDGVRVTPGNSEEYPNYYEIFVRGTTTDSDLGLYEVQLSPSPPSFNQRSLPSTLDFIVMSPGI